MPLWSHFFRIKFLFHKILHIIIKSPDYLGRTADIKGIADVCHRKGVLLIVDNAHGAYLKFSENDDHPLTLGADICCDSAHKTLPVLTGGAYLHLSKELVSKYDYDDLYEYIKSVMCMNGSTSPSYLILQSLDLCNRYLETFPQLLRDFLIRCLVPVADKS